jgi:Tfp pilus assembly protein PilX
MNLTVPQKIDAQMTVSQAVALLRSAEQDMSNDNHETSMYAVKRAEEAIKRIKSIMGVPNK